MRPVMVFVFWGRARFSLAANSRLGEDREDFWTDCVCFGGHIAWDSRMWFR